MIHTSPQECSQRRPQGYALPFTPIIASYDKNPPRGQIITARDSPPPLEEQGEVRDRFKHKKTREEKKEAVKIKSQKKKKKKEKEKKKGKKDASSIASSKISKRKVRFAKISPTSKLKSKHSTKLHSPPPRSRNVDSIESISVKFPTQMWEPSTRRVSLPASTPESSRPQWNPYAVTPVDNRNASVDSRYSSPAESHTRRDRTVSLTPVPPREDLRRRQSAVVESDDFPRAPFVPAAGSRNRLSYGESYYTDTPCAEWRSQPLIGSSVSKPQPSTREEGHGSTPGLPFLRRVSQDTTPGPSPSHSGQKSISPQGPSRLIQRSASAPQGGSGGGQTFTLVDGHYLSSRGFRGSERVVRKITLLKPDLKGRRTSHQQ